MLKAYRAPATEYRDGAVRRDRHRLPRPAPLAATGTACRDRQRSPRPAALAATGTACRDRHRLPRPAPLAAPADARLACCCDSVITDDFLQPRPKIIRDHGNCEDESVIMVVRFCGGSNPAGAARCAP